VCVRLFAVRSYCFFARVGGDRGIGRGGERESERQRQRERERETEREREREFIRNRS
jgi:hypothetical protein